jgi:hypothetical protein
VIVAYAKRLCCLAFVKGNSLYIQPHDAAPSNFYQINYQRCRRGILHRVISLV